ncbi:MAG TPA: CocE/NonD family hydrolase, partial [Chloroflexota bacterium]|nr:CocE/NonD family hydrolase [Chloroflexota bacterium]
MSNESEVPGRSTERYRVVVERDVRISMPDGTHLAMDVYLPDTSGPFPVLLERTPYDKSASMEIRMDAPNYFASRGYAVVIQDVRGCFKSEGDFDFVVNDGWGKRRDGYDTVEAIARFPWCNGRIGTIGGSYTGWTQYFLAPTRPPHLTTQYVREASGDIYFDIFQGGALDLAGCVHPTLYEALRRLVRLGLDPVREALHARISADFERLDDVHRRRPLVPILPPGHPELSSPGDEAAWHHPSKDTHWRTYDALARANDIDVPIAHLGGWYDLFAEATIAMFGAIRDRGGAKARGN